MPVIGFIARGTPTAVLLSARLLPSACHIGWARADEHSAAASRRGGTPSANTTLSCRRRPARASDGLTLGLCQGGVEKVLRQGELMQCFSYAMGAASLPPSPVCPSPLRDCVSPPLLLHARANSGRLVSQLHITVRNACGLWRNATNVCRSVPEFFRCDPGRIGQLMHEPGAPSGGALGGAPDGSTRQQNLMAIAI